MTATDPSTTGYDARAVANWFLDRAVRDGDELTQLHLHKLVYLAHGWHLARLGRPLIRDAVEAWPRGPMIPALYDEFKHFGDGPIRGRAFDFDFVRGENLVVRTVFPSDTWGLLELLWQTYEGHGEEELTRAAAEVDSPWAKLTSGGRVVITDHPVIPDEDLKAYYDDQVRAVQSMAG